MPTSHMRMCARGRLAKQPARPVACRAMDFSLSDEQNDFVAAIRDFCARECGTQEQREKLTDGHRVHHNFDLYKQMAELGWLGLTIPEAVSYTHLRAHETVLD